MVTPYFAFTCAAGKLSKVHMPSSAKAGDTVKAAAQARRLASKDFKRMGFPFGHGFILLGLFIMAVDRQGSKWLPLPREAAIIAPLGSHRIAGLASLSPALGEPLHGRAQALAVFPGDRPRRAKQSRLVIHR